MSRHRLPAIFLALALCVPAFLLPVPAAALNCPVPIGASTTEPEPQTPIWCMTSLAAPPTTGVQDGFGGYVDSFGVTGTTPTSLNDGQAGYHVTDVSAGGDSQAQHFEVNGYFVADLLKTAPEQGTDLSPAQPFFFQNGKLVLEADVNAGYPGFNVGGDVVWPEVDWSTSPTPSSASTNDGLYMYGYFQGFTAGGCRLQGSRSLTCSVQADHPLSSTTGDQPPCFSAPPARVMELSGFQSCGSTHSGFSVDFGAPANAWRQCPVGTVDPCLDRFRFEWSQDGLVAYVNGIEFARDTGWPSGSQLPTAIVNGSTPVYAHFADFGDFSDGNVYRIHWERIAVNPHDANGNPLPPSASPTFGQTPPSPTPTPSPSPSPSATPSPSPSGTPTPTPAPTPFSCNLHYGGVGHTGTCLRNADGSITFRPA